MTPRDDDDDNAERRDPAIPRMRAVVVLYFVLPLVVVMSVWLWVRHERSKIRDRGFGACLSAGRDATWCDAAADKNHERCVELTFRPGTRTSGSSFDEQGYVECLDIGDKAYWKLSAERAAERRRNYPRP